MSGTRSEKDLYILQEVGLGIYDNPRTNDAAERAFAAILLLTTELRTLSFPPPPESTWHRGDSDVSISADDEDRSWDAYKVSGYYDVLSNILEYAYDDPKLSPTTLQRLEAVRFTFVPSFLPYNSSARYYPTEGDPGVPAYPAYTYQLDACLGILRAPRVVELESDADNGRRKVEFHHRGTLGELNLRRAFFSSSGFDQGALEDACNYWPLTALCVRGADAADYDHDSDSDDEFFIPEIDVFNTSLEKVATTLKVLDISSDNSPWSPLQHLSSLHKLVALEHLRIGLPLLNTNDGFVTRPLCHILPPSLKTLTIDDSFAANHYAGTYTAEESWDESGRRKDGPRRYRRLISMALCKFASVCGKTYPKLHSVMVFGEPPIEGPRYRDTVRAMETAGPELGQVVVDAGKVRDLFALSRVELREFFHGQEPDYPFRTVHER